MTRYYLPAGMHYTTLEKRHQFYTAEFNVQKAAGWFGQNLSGVRFAVIMGRHTKIFLEKYREDAATTILIKQYKDLDDLRGQILGFLPEAVYYDRNIYNSDDQITGQELAFDLDSENVTCPIHGTLADKMARRQGLSFCELELDIVQKETVELYEFLGHRFSNLRVVYSGRGFHIHVFDKNAYTLSTQERRALAREVKDAGFHIDEWITSGECRLIRLPFSLNGLVSRVVLPLRKKDLEIFDAIHDKRCLPGFLG
ncbi:MAG: DNA primase [Nitrososphaerota archaeon]|jgi:DNA primase catalytic subunit|nr:DNA primase [Nitrososphaerota archaeon]